MAAQGAFVIIADDCPYSSSGAPGNAAGQDYSLPDNIPGGFTVGALNGRIFRLGAVNPNMPPGSFFLDPAYGMRPASGGGVSPDTVPAFLGNPYAKAYIIGAGRADPTVTGNYSGQAQDIGVYTSYFQVQ
jgi:hypothetical protein